MNMASESALEKLQRADHDTLLRVETRIEGLTNEIRQQSTIVTAATTDHEARLRVLERVNEANSGSVSGVDKAKNLALAMLTVGLAMLSIYVVWRTRK
jgi:hypothetical protein